MTWEYRLQESGDHKSFVTDANNLGSEGWELVQLQYTSGYVVGFFKRAVAVKQ